MFPELIFLLSFKEFFVLFFSVFSFYKIQIPRLVEDEKPIRHDAWMFL